MAVMIGVDPHKGSHTAVAIDRRRGRAGDDRGAVVESAGRASCSGGRQGSGSGRGRSSRLVVSVICSRSSSSRRGSGCWTCPRRCAARVRVLGIGPFEQEGPERRLLDRGRGVARAGAGGGRAGGSCGGVAVVGEAEQAARRPAHRAACRLHALLVELVPGGIPKEITVNRAARLLASSHAGQPGRS